MANKQDIVTAVNNHPICLKVPELKGATLRRSKTGNPFFYTGGFNMVFQLKKGVKKWAFRVWHVPMGATKKRYQAIAQYLSDKNLPYFANFIFDEKGILVNGKLIDSIRMEWLEDDLFKTYIERNLNNKLILDNLANDFAKMCQDLRYHQISHGDLQEGNILVSKTGEIKLIDYDSICIPEIEGQEELVTGLKGYQHPSRFKVGSASLKADYFSELIIYLSLKALAEKPSLWDKYHIKKTQYLLFSEKDFENIKTAPIYKELKGLNVEIDELLTTLVDYLNTNNYTELEPFNTQTASLIHTLKGHSHSVESVAFSPDGSTLASGGWDIKLWNAQTGDLINTLGHDSSVWSVAFSPDGSRLASGSSDKTIKLWNAQTGDLINTLKGHDSSVLSVAFSPDGSRLASGSLG